MQGKTGWWIAGACVGIVLMSIGYGLGRRAARSLPNPSAIAPAGAPLPAIQIEPIQPQEELNALSGVPGPAPTSPLAAEAALSVSPTPASGASPVPSGGFTTDDPIRVKEIQQALKLAGFDPGPVDGQMGQRTRTAIRDFQLAQGLQADGKVGTRTWGKLEPYLKNTSGEGSSSTSQR